MSEQTEHWKGPAGDAYTKRQTLPMANRVAMFERIFSATMGEAPKSVIEFGANQGDNLWAIQHTIGPLPLAGVEPNVEACQMMQGRGFEVYNSTMRDFPNPVYGWEMSMTRGVLIHIHPDDLAAAYAKLHASSRRYILIAEYYNPKPVMIPYRGQDNLLWKRDFAGEMMDRYSDLRLLDYGFVYHRDPHHPQDDVTWFLMEKMK